MRLSGRSCDGTPLRYFQDISRVLCSGLGQTMSMPNLEAANFHLGQNEATEAHLEA